MRRCIRTVATLAATIAAGTWALPAKAAELPIPVLAAQNFYGEVAAAIGGERVSVTSVLTDPGVDPHDFEPPPSVARAVADARIVIFNGADYDHWIEHMLEASERPDRVAIEAAELVGVREGDNPHVWYDPAALPAVAGAVADALSKADPDGAADYAKRRDAYLAGLAPVKERVEAIRKRFAGAPVTATEPVFGYMAEALGLAMRNEELQRAVMNETEPAARDIAAIEDDLRSGRLKLLVYNRQVTDALTERLLAIAGESGVPAVGVSETVPEGMTYADWMLGQLEAIEKALAGPSS